MCQLGCCLVERERGVWGQGGGEGGGGERWKGVGQGY